MNPPSNPPAVPKLVEAELGAKLMLSHSKAYVLNSSSAVLTSLKCVLLLGILMTLTAVKVSMTTAWRTEKWRQKFALLMNPKCLYMYQGLWSNPQDNRNL